MPTTFRRLSSLVPVLGDADGWGEDELVLGDGDGDGDGWGEDELGACIDVGKVSLRLCEDADDRDMDVKVWLGMEDEDALELDDEVRSCMEDEDALELNDEVGSGMEDVEGLELGDEVSLGTRKLMLGFALCKENQRESKEDPID